MKFPARTVVYSIAIVGLLAGLSLCVYRAPSQVRTRVERRLTNLVTVPVRAEGCEAPLGAGLRIDRLTFPAPQPLQARSLLVLEDIEEMSPGASAFVESTDPSGARPVARVFRVGSGVLSLERQIQSAGGLESDPWNHAGLVRTGALSSLLEVGGEGFLVDRLRVDLRELRLPGGEVSWSLDADRVEGYPASTGGLRCRGDLLEGEYWSAGHLEAHWTLEEGVRLLGKIDDFRGLERWVPLLGDEHQAVWDPLLPLGSVDVEIVRLVPGGRPGDRLDAVVRHYDSTLKLGRTGVRLRHLEGLVKVSESEMRFEEEVDPAPQAELWGTEVTLSGNLGSSQGTVRLTFPETRMERVPASGEPFGASRVPFLLEALRARARIEGSLAYARISREVEEWSGEFRFRDAAVPAVPFIRSFAGSLTIARTLRADSASGTEGKGRLLLDTIECTCLNITRGEVPFTWDDETVRFKLYGNVGAAKDEEPRSEPPAEGEPGSFFGTVGWSWKDSSLDVDLRWLGVEFTSDVLKVQQMGGELKLAPADGAAVSRLNLSHVTVPAGFLWAEQEDLAFDGGKSVVEVGGVATRIRSFRLLGPMRCLRAVGELRHTGELDLVVFLVEGPGHVALNELPAESWPAAWKAAAGDAFRAFRISGTVGSPSSREIFQDAPAFLEGR